MARFQALTNAVLDDELEMLREQLGLAPAQKAELLREVTALAAWVVRQVQRGCTVEARRGSSVEPLEHPAVLRLQRRHAHDLPTRIVLDDDEFARLVEIMERPPDPSPALRAALANLADPDRRAPSLRWRKTARKPR